MCYPLQMYARNVINKFKKISFNTASSDSLCTMTHCEWSDVQLVAEVLQVKMKSVVSMVWLTSQLTLVGDRGAN